MAQQFNGAGMDKLVNAFHSRTLWCIVFCCFAIGLWSIVKMNQDANTRAAEMFARQYLQELELSVDAKILKSVTDLNKIINYEPSQAYLRGDISLQPLKQAWLNFAYRIPNLNQLRYLNAKGQSIRIMATGNDFFVVPQYVVKDELEHYYFHSLKSMDANSAYLSPLSLHAAQHDQMSDRTMLYSLARKVWDENEQNYGVVVASFTLQELLQNPALEAAPFDFYIMQHSGVMMLADSGEVLDSQIFADMDLAEFSFNRADNIVIKRDNQALFAMAMLSPFTRGDVVAAHDFPWRLVARIDRESMQTFYPGLLNKTYITVMLASLASGVLMLLGIVFKTHLAEQYANARLHQKKQKYAFTQAVMGIIDEGILLIDREGKVVFANSAAHEILAGDHTTLTQKTVQQVLPVHVMLTFFQRDQWRVGECKVSIPNAAKRNSVLESTERKHLRVVNFESCYIEEMYCIRCQDVTETLELESQLNYRKNFDLLTQTMTRQSLEAHVANAFLAADMKASLVKASVLYIDLDDFRSVNQMNGFPMGDRALQEIGKRLKKMCKKIGVVARIGGDEFVVFSDTHYRLNAVKNFAHQVLNAIAQPLVLDELTLKIEASIGIAIAPADGESPQQLIRCAEKTMQKAKRAGGAQYAEADETPQKSESRFLELGREIRDAIKHDEFTVRYQPVFDLKQRGLKGFEAFLRWNHKERGLLSPAAFLEHLENSRMIVDVGFEVIRKSCRFIARINRSTNRPLHISVNLSPRQFVCRDLLPGLRQILMETECNPAWLELEIPETALLRNTDSAAEILKKIRQLGARVSIDDFGTGYSSLDYLKKLDVDQLKIDKSFVCNAQVHNEDKAILEFTTFLAKKLNLSVIAEGVEVAETDKLLQELGINTGQGYFYAKPMTEQKAEKFVALHSGGHLSQGKRISSVNSELSHEKVVRFPVRD
ncbi:Cyclic di-GMP phosphodiesterase Gmr [Thalassocella blandensis]|nr:Cyclic di-GMP phosphodiesterase Gmr [Thalassocella blandensis]